MCVRAGASVAQRFRPLTTQPSAVRVAVVLGSAPRLGLPRSGSLLVALIIALPSLTARASSA